MAHDPLAQDQRRRSLGPAQGKVVERARIGHKGRQAGGTPGQGKRNHHGLIRVYHADCATAQADPALVDLFARGGTPFDRLDWLARLARECLDPAACTIAIARQDLAIAALPLLRAGPGWRALGNWYSFIARPRVSDPARAVPLLAAILRDLRPAALDAAPLPGQEAQDLHAAMRAAGWIAHAAPCDTNHVALVHGQSFATWWAQRPGALRETVRRKGRKGTVVLRIADRFDAADWQAFETVYAQSWKPAEASPDFLRHWAIAESAAGRLRLGLAHVDGRPVAAQFWTVEAGTAFIHKLAHVRDAQALSPGTLLSHALFARAIDGDRVDLVDFGTGDDPYKRDWTDATRPRWRVTGCAPRVWPLAARLLARRLRSVWRGDRSVPNQGSLA